MIVVVVFFFLQSTEFSETPSPDTDSVTSLEGHSEPSWFKDIKFDDSDTEQLADENDLITTSEKILDTTGYMFHQCISISFIYLFIFLKKDCIAVIQAQPAPAKGHQSVASIQQWTAIQLPPLT